MDTPNFPIHGLNYELLGENLIRLMIDLQRSDTDRQEPQQIHLLCKAISRQFSLGMPRDTAQGENYSILIEEKQIIYKKLRIS